MRSVFKECRILGGNIPVYSMYTIIMHNYLYFNGSSRTGNRIEGPGGQGRRLGPQKVNI